VESILTVRGYSSSQLRELYIARGAHGPMATDSAVDVACKVIFAFDSVRGWTPTLLLQRPTQCR
jgi:hypothetical protein